MNLSPAQEAAIREAARPILRKTLRHGLIIGFALGVVSALILVAMAWGH